MDTDLSDLTEPELAAAFRDRLGPDAHLLDRVEFGLAVQRFCQQSEVGMYLVNRAEEQIERHRGALMACDDLDSKEAREAHFKARVADAIMLWLGEAIAEGLEAEQVLVVEEAE